VAFSLAATCDAEVVIAHVDVERTAPIPVGAPGSAGPAVEQRRRHLREGVADGVVYEAADLARRLGIRPRTLVRRADSRAAAICELVGETESDLIVLGAELQPVAGETYLGDLVERLIRAVPCSVAVVAMPREALGMSTDPYPTS
jgi:nucleotide-binding universal stress UspA family protein